MTTTHISCLCFSKDRPLQLDGYLISLRLYSGGDVRITVLYTTSNERFESAYESLRAQHPDVDFIKEVNFRRHVTRWIENTTSLCVLFGCDDVVFKRPFNSQVVSEAAQNNEFFGFSLRLGFGLSYNGTLCQPMGMPRVIQASPLLVWDWRDSKSNIDWAYPFELSASVYPTAIAREMVAALNHGAEGKWGHPNSFESYGSVIAQSITGHRLMAAFPETRASTITVNRVQDVCKNVIFDPTSSFTPERLLDLWERGTRLDVDAYAGKDYPAIHVGDLRLSCPPGVQPPEIPQYDFHRDMIMDFADKVQSNVQSGVAMHPGISNYIKEFDTYFHLPCAETASPVNLRPCLNDKTSVTGVDAIYFHQDTWAFSRVKEIKPTRVVDVGSTALLVGIFSYMAPTESVDIRPLPVSLPGLRCIKGSILELPYKDKSVECLTSVCVIEHIGLGRYGDPLDPMGSLKALREIRRVIAPGGHFIGSLNISSTSFVEFNAHRVFQKTDILAEFQDFELMSDLYLNPTPVPPEEVDKLMPFDYAVWCFDLRRSLWPHLN